MKPGMTLLATICLLVAFGCAALSYRAPVQISDEKINIDSLKAHLNYYPEEFRVSQHIIVSIGGKQYDFIGYLVKNHGNGLRALAFGEMGGTLFDFVQDKEHREVLRWPEGMPLNPLLDGVIADINFLYNPAIGDNVYGATRQAGGVSLIYRDKTGGFTEHIFSNDICVTSIEVAFGKAIRKADFADYQLFSGWGKPLPAKITVTNFRWHYEMKIELLKIELAPADGKVAPLLR